MVRAGQGMQETMVRAGQGQKSLSEQDKVRKHRQSRTGLEIIFREGQDKK
jgi:hypothetical protein